MPRQELIKSNSKIFTFDEKNICLFRRPHYGSTRGICKTWKLAFPVQRYPSNNYSIGRHGPLLKDKNSS